MRVVAGRYGGRTLKAPKGLAVRPTADRVREALFSILGDVSGLAQRVDRLDDTARGGRQRERRRVGRIDAQRFAAQAAAKRGQLGIF